jgi:glutamine amidotransferase
MIAIIDYRAGNLTSVRLAFEALGREAVITDDPARIRAAERVVFPGVGAAGAAMRHLQSLDLAGTIRDVARRGTPFLGICLGTQIILERSDEDGGTDTLGLLPGRVIRFAPTNRYDKVPHMGWNQVDTRAAHPVFEGITPGSEFYFVHSYYPAPADPACILGTTDYAGVTFASALARGSIVATQFHPEKSGRAGLQLLENFCRWQPAATEAVPC